MQPRIKKLILRKNTLLHVKKVQQKITKTNTNG